MTTPPTPTPTPTPTTENHPPEAQNQQVTTEADKPVAISLGAIDNDTGDSLSAEIVTPPQPDHGSLGQIDQNTGNVTYTPAAGFSGNDSFTFKVIDSHQAESNVGTVSITVSPPVSTTQAPIELPPHTIGTSPANGSINIPTKADKLTATFDQDIDTTSAKISLKDSTGNEIPVDVTSDGPTVTITPKSDLNPGTNYTVSIDQISGKGKTNVGSVIFGFTTVPEVTTPPTPQHQHQHQQQKIIHQKHRISKLRPRLTNRWPYLSEQLIMIRETLCLLK